MGSTPPPIAPKPAAAPKASPSPAPKPAPAPTPAPKPSPAPTPSPTPSPAASPAASPSPARETGNSTERQTAPSPSPFPVASKSAPVPGPASQLSPNQQAAENNGRAQVRLQNTPTNTARSTESAATRTVASKTTKPLGESTPVKATETPGTSRSTASESRASTATADAIDSKSATRDGSDPESGSGGSESGRPDQVQREQTTADTARTVADTAMAGSSAQSIEAAKSNLEAAKAAVDPSSEVAQELQTKIDELTTRSKALQPQVEAYTRVQAQIAENNFAQIQGLGNLAGREARDKLSGPKPFSSLTPVKDSDIPVATQAQLRQMSEETTRQIRQDIRDGRVSAIIDGSQYQGLSGTESVAQMRVQQGLQDAGIPQDFNGASPSNREELMAMQAIGRVSEVADTRGISRELNALQAERTQLNEQLALVGREPVTLPELQQSIDRMAELDKKIIDAGVSMTERMGGFPVRELSPFKDASILKTDGSPANGTGQITELQSPNGPLKLAAPIPTLTIDGQTFVRNTDNAAVLDNMQSSSMGATLQKPLTEAQTNELIRVNDSLNLLRGNQSGFTIKDVPMSADLRSALSIPASLPQGDNAPLAGAFDAIPKAIDRIALLPAEQRLDAVKNVSHRIIGETVSQEFTTKAIGDSFDKTLMARIAGSGGVPESYNKLAAVQREGTLDMLNLAGSSAVYNSFAQSMDTLRKANGYTLDQKADNEGFRQLYMQTQLQSAMFATDMITGVVMAGGSALTSSLRGAANSTVRQTSQQFARQGLTQLGKQELKQLAQQEASTLARQQLAQVTKSDFNSLVRQQLGSLTRQQAGEIAEAEARQLASQATANQARNTGDDLGDVVVIMGKDGKPQFFREPKPTSSPQPIPKPTEAPPVAGQTPKPAVPVETGPKPPIVGEIPPGTDPGNIVLFRDVGPDGKPVIRVITEPGTSNTPVRPASPIGSATGPTLKATTGAETLPHELPQGLTPEVGALVDRSSLYAGRAVTSNEAIDMVENLRLQTGYQGPEPMLFRESSTSAARSAGYDPAGHALSYGQEATPLMLRHELNHMEMTQNFVAPAKAYYDGLSAAERAALGVKPPAIEVNQNLVEFAAQQGLHKDMGIVQRGFREAELINESMTAIEAYTKNPTTINFNRYRFSMAELEADEIAARATGNLDAANALSRVRQAINNGSVNINAVNGNNIPVSMPAVGPSAIPSVPIQTAAPAVTLSNEQLAGIRQQFLTQGSGNNAPLIFRNPSQATPVSVDVLKGRVTLGPQATAGQVEVAMRQYNNILRLGAEQAKFNRLPAEIQAITPRPKTVAPELEARAVELGLHLQ